MLSIWASLAVLSGCGGSAIEGSPGGGGSNSSGASAGSVGTGALPGFAGGGSTSTGGTSSIGGMSAGGIGAGGASDITACTENSQCVLEPVSCCSCGIGPVSSFTAINATWVGSYNQRCGAVDCGPCPSIPADPNNPVFYYVRTCQSGHCTVVDLKTTDITTCTTPNECEARTGTACCESCNGGPTVALNASHASELSKLVCDQGGGAQGCPACPGPQPPPPAFACENGRCVIAVGMTCSPTNPCPD